MLISFLNGWGLLVQPNGDSSNIVASLNPYMEITLMYHKKRVSLCDKQQRIIIIGTSCSGKTTLAQQVSQQLAIKHVELDELHWLPGWQEREPAVFRQMVTDVVSGDSWVVVCG